MRRITCAAIAAAALVLGSGPASANLDLDEMGALLALPFVTAGFEYDECSTETCPEETGTNNLLSNAQTEIVVSNGLAEAINLHVNIINGDDGEGWETASFDCWVTAHETTRFVFTNDGAGGSDVSFECSATGANANSPAEDLNIQRNEALNAARGIMVVAVEQSGATISKNAIFGDSTILDALGGLAWSVGAISFQGLDPLNQDGDRQYEFDALEYAAFPSLLSTNFFATSATLHSELILFTLDGTADVTPVPVDLRIFFYDDDERERDTSYAFDCFTIVALEDIDPRFQAASLGSETGYMTLRSRNVEVPTVHDLSPGAVADGFRNTPAHGWYIVSESGSRAGARRLIQDVNLHVPLAGDVVNFDAR